MSTSEPVRIAILNYPGAQVSAVHGLTDLFATANSQRGEAGQEDDVTGPDRPLEPVILDPGGINETPNPAVLILPPSLESGSRNPGDRTRLVQWVRSRAEAGTVVCSICAGAFLLAEAGLVQGRTITTHWALADRFRAIHPEVLLDTDKMIIEDGSLITAGGLMAWVDLGLRLVERFLGSAVMLRTARFFLVDAPGREQRFYAHFAPRMDHGDERILGVQRWLQEAGPRDAGPRDAGEEGIGIPAMAERAGLGERTFLRRFQRATGLRPTAYVQQVRISKARDLLAFSSTGIDEIAWQVGYADPAGFRKIFKRDQGLSPGEYRRRFAVGTAQSG